uniref:Uncharacterized protein n=1 Tax=Terrapene triunguis TaxID=2587831 RepID=A0A674J666_9SAUR
SSIDFSCSSVPGSKVGTQKMRNHSCHLSETFWTTTGMFPQEFIISFHKCVKISKLTIQCYLGKNAMYFHVLIFTVVSHSAADSLKNNPQECS